MAREKKQTDWGVGDWGEYTYDEASAAKHGGRIAEGDCYPFVAITVDEDSGDTHGYVFTPDGIHYVGPVGNADDDEAQGEDAGADNTTGGSS